MSRPTIADSNSESVRITIRVADELRRKLQELANRYERSLSAEAKIAIREHIQTHKEQSDDDQSG
jgi:predicted transcriptional regulator